MDLEKLCNEFNARQAEPFHITPDLAQETFRLLSSCRTDEEKAKKILDYVHHLLEYKKEDYGVFYPLNAGEIFSRKTGLCLDFSILFTSMARLSGLEAGCASDRKSHAYVYASLNGNTVFMDPTKNEFDCTTPVYVEPDNYVHQVYSDSQQKVRPMKKSNPLQRISLAVGLYLLASNQELRQKIESDLETVKTKIEQLIYEL